MCRKNGKQQNNIFFCILKTEWRAGRQPGRQDLAPALRHHQGVLKLGGPGAIARNGRPPVRPGRVPPGPRVHHGLDRKDLPRLHRADGLVACVVRDVGGAVEQVADAMTAIGADDVEAACVLKSREERRE